MDAKSLDRAKLTQAHFQRESVNITPPQLIKIRSLFSAVGVPCQPKEELAKLPALLAKLRDQAAKAGGSAPAPEAPKLTTLEAIEAQTGNAQLLDLSPLIARDKVKTDIYSSGLYETWGRDAKQYGLPKDWDTVAFLVNMEHAKKQGVTLAELQNMSWNPKDGGSFEQLVKKLTVDSKGNNATSPNFDKKNVAVYGYQTPGPGGMTGQTEWSHFAVSNGFKFQDARWDG